MDLTHLPHGLNPDRNTVRAVVETPKGSRSKYNYDPDSGLFALGGLLPEGMSFPMDFGFIPSTRGEDGDPIDVLILHDEPLAVGALAHVRLIGIIEGNQSEGGATVRNDRLVAITECSRLHAKVEHIDEFGPTFVENLTTFWVNYNALKGKTYAVSAVHGPDAAVRALQNPQDRESAPVMKPPAA